MLEIAQLHHVSLPVSEPARSKRFYAEVLELEPIERPPFDFDGAWYRIGDGQLHLIADDGDATFRGDKGIDSRDAHFAIRVRSFTRAVQELEAKGFSTAHDDAHPRKMRVNPRPTAGFPQIYILDPDRNVIEINAEALD